MTKEKTKEEEAEIIIEVGHQCTEGYVRRKYRKEDKEFIEGKIVVCPYCNNRQIITF